MKRRSVFKILAGLPIAASMKRKEKIDDDIEINIGELAPGIGTWKIEDGDCAYFEVDCKGKTWYLPAYKD